MASKRKTGQPDLFLNRELSWLEFNQRVLDEALDERVPLLERVKFLAITASNLDEFFMVRVGGLYDLVERGVATPDDTGLSPRRQVEEVIRRVRAMTADQYACLAKQLEAPLETAGIVRVGPGQLAVSDLSHLSQVFEQEILPLLTPRAIDPEEEFPRLAGLTLHLAVRLRKTPGGGDLHAVVPIPRTLPRFYSLPDQPGYRHMLVEDVVTMFLDRLFPGCELVESAVFRVTRNADLSVIEDLASDLLERMRQVLVARRESACVRLEVTSTAAAGLVNWLKGALGAAEDRTFRCPGPLALSSYFGFADMSGFEECKNEAWPPQPSPQIPAGEPMFDVLARRDVLLYAPYEAYDPVVRFVEEAAADPDVLAIKQILYRTSRRSPIVAALARAAEQGKQVTALVELKARFDEARNIEWARALERSGVQVIYGIRGFKTHAKICLVVRREPAGIRRYVHFGTGNYNEQTALVYGDLSYMTSAEDYGADASAFFNAITGFTQPPRYRRIEAAPLGIRPRLMELIEGEIACMRRGEPARIVAKINSLSDTGIIRALYQASKAGVKIDLLVRGICCLRPGVPGLSENIRVFSVVDRFLEHARVFYFHGGGRPQLFIASADWMARNLDKRIELMVSIEDPGCRQRLLQVLETHLKDNVKARELRADGRYVRLRPAPGRRRFRSQEELYKAARRAARDVTAAGKGVFVPHRPPVAR